MYPQGFSYHVGTRFREAPGTERLSRRGDLTHRGGPRNPSRAKETGTNDSNHARRHVGPPRKPNGHATAGSARRTAASPQRPSARTATRPTARPMLQKSAIERHGPDVASVTAALWEQQRGKCYLCGIYLVPGAGSAVALDHDHRCCPAQKSCKYCRRGLACDYCNTLIGLANDDPRAAATDRGQPRSRDRRCHRPAGREACPAGHHPGRCPVRCSPTTRSLKSASLSATSPPRSTTSSAC